VVELIVVGVIVIAALLLAAYMVRRNLRSVECAWRMAQDSHLCSMSFVEAGRDYYTFLLDRKREEVRELQAEAVAARARGEVPVPKRTPPQDAPMDFQVGVYGATDRGNGRGEGS